MCCLWRNDNNGVKIIGFLVLTAGEKRIPFHPPEHEGMFEERTRMCFPPGDGGEFLIPP